MRNRFSRPIAAVVALLLSLLLTACGAGAVSSELPAADIAGQADGGARPEFGNLPMDDGDSTSDDGRLIIRTKVLRLEVDSTPDAVDQVRELTRTHNGSVTDMQIATDSEDWVYHYDEYGNPVGDGTALRGWVTVRVPSESYEDFVAEIAGLGTIKFQSEATSDVTQEHVDLSARLENLRAQEARLREFFDAAKDVKEMLAVEQELGRVRGEIESMDAQVTYLERQAAMATVTVELVEPRAVVRPEGDSWGFVDAITTGIRGAAAVLTGAMTVLIATSPLWILGAILFFPIRARLRRRRAAKAAVLTTEEEPTPPSAP